jgi:tetratricopeptide (TPR) repeat protein
MNFAVRIVTGFSLLFLLVISVPAQAAQKHTDALEGILHNARQLINGAENNPRDLRQAIELLERAEKRFPQDYRIPLGLAEAWYRLADPEEKIDVTWPLYNQAEKYSLKAAELEGNLTDARYWYGLAQLKRAQKEGGISAYFATRRGIAAQQEVLDKNPGYDHAGAARVLTLLYTVAPGWSPFGDLDKAIDYGRQAIRLAPHYPLNRLYLARAYEKAGKRQAAAKQYREILAQEGVKFKQEARNRLRELGGMSEDASS